MFIPNLQSGPDNPNRGSARTMPKKCQVSSTKTAKLRSIRAHLWETPSALRDRRTSRSQSMGKLLPIRPWHSCLCSRATNSTPARSPSPACCSVDLCSGRSLARAVGERPYFTSQTSPPRSSLFKSPGPFCWIIWFTCSFTTSSYRGRSSHARNSPMGVGKPGRPSMCESRNA